ncbi:MAG: hypothetical protein IJL35_02150 [Bacteroidaceae bacterium]|nr:hypothetical protein [Bacteroidaceae bacterium]
MKKGEDHISPLDGKQGSDFLLAKVLPVGKIFRTFATRKEMIGDEEI